MRKSEPSVGPRLFRAGLAVAATAAVVAAAAATPAQAAVAGVSLSATAGPTTGTNTITATSTAAASFLTGVTAPVTTFSIPTCQTTYNTTASTAVTPSSATSGNVLAGANATKKLSNVKASILVPALPIAVSTAASQKYNVCIYASSTAGAAQIAGTTYTVAVAPSLTSVSPSSGPSLGGSKITVTGTAFPTTANSITATLGGVPLTQVTPVNATSFTAVTPARAPGTATLAVTTAAGTKTLASAYTFANGISIDPNTSPAASATTANPVYLDIMGAGFSEYTWTGAGAAKVWLVDGKYDAGSSTSGSGGGAATEYANGPTANCGDVVMISDNEIICSMNLNTGALTPTTGAANSGTPKVPDGAYTVTVVSDGRFGQSDADGFKQTDISSGSTFTVAEY